MKLSLSKLSIPNVDPVTFIDVAYSAGFANVGLNLFDVYRRCMAQGTDFSEQIQAIAHKAWGHHIGMLHCGHCILGDMREDELHTVLAAARRCKAQYCVGIAHPHAAPSQVAGDFSQLVRHALESGLQVCVEYSAYSGIKNLMQAFEFVRRYPAEQAGIMLDALHVFRNGDLEHISRIDPAYIRILQLCDGPLKNPPPDRLQLEARGNRLDVGDGEFALADLLKAVDPSVPIEIESPNVAYRNVDPYLRAEYGFNKAVSLINRVRH